jgi:cytochrome c-type biogenesis protein CcmH/NrfF
LRADGVLAGALLASALLGAADAARADEDPHGRRAELRTLSELTPQQRRLAEQAFSRIVCACPRENWSKTLANCPDGCAVPQKQLAIARIVEGRTLDEIVAEQVKRYGSKAAADPGAFWNGAWLVGGTAAAGLVVAGFVLARWASAARRRRAEPPAANDADRAETAAVERELREID